MVFRRETSVHPSRALLGFVVFAAGLILSVASFAQEDTVQTLTVTRTPVAGMPPVTESFIVSAPPSAPTAVLILFPGREGNIQLTALGSDGTLDVNSENTLVRSRWLFASQGFAVLTVDSASDFQQLPHGLDKEQGSAAHMQDILQVIAWARSAYPGVPVWAVGHSRGTGPAFVAAANSPSAGGPDGLVLMAPNDDNPATDPDSALAVGLAGITVPALILSNELDACNVTTPAAELTVKQELKNSRSSAITYIKGGFPTLLDACHALSYHGFLGIEPQAVAVVTNFINTEERVPVTTTAVSTSGSPSLSGQPVTFTATVTSIFPVPDGGTVTFFDGITQIGTATTSGGIATFTTFSLSVGLHEIKAVYAGEGSFKKSFGDVRRVVQR